MRLWPRAVCGLQLIFSVCGLCLSCEPSQPLDSTDPLGLAYTQTHMQTFSLPMRTMYYPDSIPTQSDEYLLVGEYNHPIFGHTNARTYVRLQNPNVLETIPLTATLDSIIFRMKLSYLYGKSRPSIGLSVYSLTQALEVDTTYLSNYTTPYETLLPSIQFYDRIDTTLSQYLYIKAKPIWSQRFFNSILQSGSNRYLQDHNGFVLLSEQLSEGIVGFSPSGSSINIHYKVLNQALVKRLTLSGPRYNHLSTDRSGSPLSALQQSGDQLPQTNTSYLQGGSGVFIALDVSEVKAKYQELKAIGIQLADLHVRAMPQNAQPERYLFKEPIAIGVARAPLKSSLSMTYFLRHVLGADAYYLTRNRLDFYVARTQENAWTYRGQLTTALQAFLEDDTVENDQWILFTYDYNSLSPLVVNFGQVQLKVHYTLRK